ncbi:MAG: hypothetical protein SFT93_00915 [Rickettsiaceae bacterium]|nr:hypothetical protein [Rickettsiaceae bacterium]
MKKTPKQKPSIQDILEEVFIQPKGTIDDFEANLRENDYKAGEIQEVTKYLRAKPELTGILSFMPPFHMLRSKAVSNFESMRKNYTSMHPHKLRDSYSILSGFATKILRVSSIVAGLSCIAFSGVALAAGFVTIPLFGLGGASMLVAFGAFYAGMGLYYAGLSTSADYKRCIENINNKHQGWKKGTSSRKKAHTQNPGKTPNNVIRRKFRQGVKIGPNSHVTTQHRKLYNRLEGQGGGGSARSSQARGG